MEQRANEALVVAVGLGAVRPGEVVANRDPVAARPESVASIVAAVVRQQPPERDAVGRIPRVGPFEEPDDGRPLFVGEHLAVAMIQFDGPSTTPIFGVRVFHARAPRLRRTFIAEFKLKAVRRVE